MTLEKDPAFLDDEERDIIESFETALESGSLLPCPPEARAKANSEWQARAEKASGRRSIAWGPR